jgi:ribonuclease HI
MYSYVRYNNYTNGMLGALRVASFAALVITDCIFDSNINTKNQHMLRLEIYMKRVTLYTDGACSGNPGPGGYGAILIYKGHEKEISGGEEMTTNNRMELMAAIAGLEALREPCIVDLYSDSKYLVDGISKGWAASWRSRGWIKSDKKPALNPDLWERLLNLLETHKVTLHWVKGHAENEYNNRCDKLAVAESLKFSKQINNSNDSENKA